MLEVNIEKKLTSFTLSFNQLISCQGVTAILGVSGAGKSTFINIINGLIKPDKGKIKLNDTVLVNTEHKLFVPPQHRRIASVFQDPLLFPHYNVKKNLNYGLDAAMAPRFNEIIDVLNIGHLLNRYPATLSGGEKQRVAIGRALLSNPQLLLLDEPLSALDMPRKNELIYYIQKLIDELNVPIIYVTHNLNEVKKLAHEIAIIEQGSLYQFGDAKTMLQCDYLKTWL